MPQVAYAAAQETIKAAQVISDATQVAAQAISDKFELNPTARINALLHDKLRLNDAIAHNAITLSQDLQVAIDEHFKQLSDQSKTIPSQIKLNRMLQIKHQLEEKQSITFSLDKTKTRTYHEKQLKTLKTLMKAELQYCKRHQAELKEDIARAHENFENKMNISRDNIAITAANTRHICILAGEQPHRLTSAKNFQDLANFKVFIEKVTKPSDR
jgi:ribosomal protein S13